MVLTIIIWSLCWRPGLVKVYHRVTLDDSRTRVLSNLTMPDPRWLMALISEHLTWINDLVASRVDEFTRVHQTKQLIVCPQPPRHLPARTLFYQPRSGCLSRHCCWHKNQRERENHRFASANFINFHEIWSKLWPSSHVHIVFSCTLMLYVNTLFWILTIFYIFVHLKIYNRLFLLFIFNIKLYAEHCTFKALKILQGPLGLE